MSDEAQKRRDWRAGLTIQLVDGDLLAVLRAALLELLHLARRERGRLQQHVQLVPANSQPVRWILACASMSFFAKHTTVELLFNDNNENNEVNRQLFDGGQTVDSNKQVVSGPRSSVKERIGRSKPVLRLVNTGLSRSKETLVTLCDFPATRPHLSSSQRKSASSYWFRRMCLNE